MYEAGDGVKPDKVEAAKWYRKSADQGDDSAQAGLGWMYYEGQGVKQDYAEAYFWLCLAPEFFDDTRPHGFGWDVLHKVIRLLGIGYYYISNNDTMVISRRDKALVHLVPEQRAAIEKRVQKWKPDFSSALKFAEQGNTWAYAELGNLYLFELKGEPSYDEAYFWHSLAMKSGDNSEAYMLPHYLDVAAQHLTAEQKSTLDKRVEDWFQAHPAPGASSSSP
jgi:TPR repeat protein